MRNISRILSLTLGLIVATAVSIPAQAAFPTKWHPGHYWLIHFGTQNSQWEFNYIKNEPNFVGVHRRYAWKWLEPTRGAYDFSMIEADLKYLMSMPTPKRLIIEITDNSNWPLIWLPDYIRTPEFEGGFYKPAYMQRVITKRWNTALQDRQIALFKALGARFDNEPFVEGIVLDETSNGNLIWKGVAAEANYTSEKAYIGQKRIMAGLKAAFPRTMCVQYINWWSGDSAADVELKLKGLVEYAYSIGMGLGGPDVHASRPVSSQPPPYKLYGQYAGSMPLAPAVQWSNYTDINPVTGRASTVEEILNFANRTLHASHLSWEQREPFSVDEVIPLVRRAGAPTGSVVPSGSSPVSPTGAVPSPTPTLVVTPTPTTPISVPTFTNLPAPVLASSLLVRPKGKAVANPVGPKSLGKLPSTGSKGVRMLKRNKGMTTGQSARRLKLKRTQISSSKATSLSEMLARINVVK
ncbi:MAG: hypothetical protein ABIR48_06585 [Gammaproteobacteria bacterium]